MSLTSAWRRSPKVDISPTADQHDVGATSEDRVRILYIGGTGRTGSTLLANLLGQFEQFFSAGEVTLLWRLCLMGTSRCACGSELLECPVWSEIFRRAFGGVGNVDVHEMIRLSRRLDRMLLPLTLSRGLRDRLVSATGSLPHTLARLYATARATTGARVIIDSSKAPQYSYLLRSRASLDVYFVHLVRDSRAVAHSWHRSKSDPGFGEVSWMQKKFYASSAAGFSVANAASELLWADAPEKYMRVRYEDLVAAPGPTIERIAHFVNESVNPGRIIDRDSAHLGPTHCLWGNPSRFEHGSVRLTVDAEWRTHMPRSARALVTAMTLPLLIRYGYPPRG